jgi:hypothetical protein
VAAAEQLGGFVAKAANGQDLVVRGANVAARVDVVGEAFLAQVGGYARAGTDFFTVEVLTWRGLVTYYVLFFLHVESRRVTVAGITRHPDEEWMQQMARNATQDGWGPLNRCRYVLHDRDTKFCASFRSVLAAGGVKTIQLPARSPNLNAFPERWVRSVKEECLSKRILFGERPLARVLSEFSAHYHGERNHQGKGNELLFPEPIDGLKERGQAAAYHQRLGGLLKYYGRAA